MKYTINHKKSRYSIIHIFLLRITEGESLQSVRGRMLERFKDITEKEFEKYKFSLITHGRMTPLSDDFTFNSSDFITNVDKDTKPSEFPSLKISDCYKIINTSYFSRYYRSILIFKIICLDLEKGRAALISKAKW